MYWLDYSAAKLSGQTIKNAGYGGVIRYIDSRDRLRTKHTTPAEYASHKQAGIDVMLVMQNTTTDADGGWNTGVANAKRALDGAQYIGYSGPIFFTNDRTTVPNASAWKSYLDGASSVLGVNRVGAYGFGNAMDLAVGHATYFWQAGRRADVRSQVHVYQDNNTQVTVGGITCDRNLIMKNFSLVTMEEDDMFSDGDRNNLTSVHGAVFYGGGDAGPKSIVQRLADLETSVAKLSTGGIDATVIAAAVAEQVSSVLARQVADEVARRMAA